MENSMDGEDWKYQMTQLMAALVGLGIIIGATVTWLVRRG